MGWSLVGSKEVTISVQEGIPPPTPPSLGPIKSWNVRVPKYAPAGSIVFIEIEVTTGSAERAIPLQFKYNFQKSYGPVVSQVYAQEPETTATYSFPIVMSLKILPGQKIPGIVCIYSPSIAYPKYKDCKSLSMIGAPPFPLSEIYAAIREMTGGKE